ncbi:MAG: hypothetical protein HUU37_05510, partial [Bdellovibrionales bacterium]|nr:hypothetical protein [Bdellovibrionales bacterium]
GLSEVNVRELPAFKVDLMNVLRDVDDKVPGLSRQILSDVDRMKFAFTSGSVPASHDECLGVQLNTEQLAIQNGSSVVISQNLYEKLSSKSRAALLLHEILVWKENNRSAGKTRKCTTFVREAVRAIFRPETPAQDLITAYYDKLLGDHAKRPAGLITKGERVQLKKILKSTYLDGECKKVEARYKSDHPGQETLKAFDQAHDDASNKIHKMLGYHQGNAVLGVLRMDPANFSRGSLPNARSCLLMQRWVSSKDGLFDDFVQALEQDVPLLYRRWERERTIACLRAEMCGTVKDGKPITGEDAVKLLKPLPKEVEEVDYDNLMNASEAR